MNKAKILGLVKKEWKAHRENYDKEEHEWYECDEVENKSFTVVGDTYCIDEQGKTTIQSKEQTQKEYALMKCPMCQRFRRIIREIKRVGGKTQ